ncbi:MAG: hypothetical protein KBS52_00530 [Clostridiales bacterium]|nr:hypothetical protein [Candidatus Equinaster intestinalis]
MDEKCYKAVISEMKELLDEQSFTEQNGIFVNENKAVKVWYDEQSKCFNLSAAPVVSGDIGEFAVLSNWLFDESQTEKDAYAVGVDFADTLRINLGIKKVASRGSAQVTLPVAEKGDDVTVLTLTQKLLAIFPEKKEIYKESVAENGKYLYIEFMSKEFVPEIIKMLDGEGANKKQLKKLFDMFSEVYVEGDGTTADMIVAIIGAAIYGSEKRAEAAAKYYAENNHLKICVKEFVSELGRNKKLRRAMKIEG